MLSKNLDNTTALAVLEDALDRCLRKEDVRSPDVFAAPDFLEARAAQKWPFAQFCQGLESRDPEGRWQIMNASLNGIRLTIAGK